LQAVVDFVKDANAELAKLLSGTVSVSIPGVTTRFPSSGGSGSNAGNGTGQAGNGRVGNEMSSPAPTATNVGDALAIVDKRQSQLDAARAALDKQNASIQETQNTIKNLTQQRATLVPSKRADIQIKIDRLNEVLAIQQKSVRPLQQTVSAALQALKAAEASVPRLSGTPNTASQIPFRGMRDGGMVLGPGSGTSDSINARLSNGEYVLRANAVKYYGADFMNSLNQMQVQRPGATAGSNVVYLSPDDRALLRAAIDRPIALYTENTRIAESANNGNVVLAQRGMK
jgi:hypothetical protein